MKKRNLLVGFLMVSIASQAQITERYSKIEAEESSRSHVVSTTTEPVITGEGSDYFAKALIDAEGVVLLTEDFAGGIPGTWGNTSLSSGNEEWEYRGTSTTPNNTVGSRGEFATGTGVIASATASNGFVIFDSDWMDNNGGSGTGQQPLGTHKGALTLPSVNCAAYSGLFIEFTEYLRHYASDNLVLVSTDNWSTEDTVYNGSDDVDLNASSADDRFIRINVSDIAAGESNVQVRFLYSSQDNTTASSGPGYYFWQIDDIVLSTPPDNDLTIAEIFTDGAGTTATKVQASTYYTQIPEKQANADVLTFGAEVVNNGSAAQPNTVLEVTVDSYTGTSTSQTLAVQTEDSIDVSTTYTPDGGTGNYEVEFTISSDSTDDFMDDNTAGFEFEVTESVYSRDDDNLATGWSYNNGQSYSILTRYEFNDADTVKAVHVAFWNSATFVTDVGAVVEVGMWPVVDAGGSPSTIATDGVIDFDNPVGGTTTFLTLANGDLNTVLPVNYNNPVPVSAGEVVAGFRVTSGVVRTAATQQDVAPLQSFVDVDNDGVGIGWIDFAPLIRIETYSSSICDNVTIIPTITAECRPSAFEADLIVDVSTNGSSNYEVSWNVGGSSDTITIDEEGTYSVVVTDDDFCTGSAELVFANGDFNCNLSVDEFGNNGVGFNILPNPNNGQFSLAFNSVKGNNVDVTVQSLKGEIIYTNSTAVSNGSVLDINLDGVSSGVYLVKVTDETSSSVERIVVQ